MTKKCSLAIVGCGIKFMSHLTVEAMTWIKKSNKVLYLINEPAMREWLHTNHPDAQSLEGIYSEFRLRKDIYSSITQNILDSLTIEQHVCVVLEGHPTVFAKPALDAVLFAKNRGYRTVILPGISAEDYLFAELHIDPGTIGCLSYEATDFLIYKRLFDGCSHLILWQVSVIGMIENKPEHSHREGTQVLVDHLNRCYDLSHEVIMFEGSQYPHVPSRIEKCQLWELPQARLTRTTTLYIPPARKAEYDQKMIIKLGLTDIKED